jgi:D-sedoheptulose 7-phosphate isomerase
MIFAQAVMALGREGDALICISTSGNAANTVNAAVVAKSLGMTVIALTGEGGGRLAAVADVAVRVPEKETFKVQELHLPLYHYLCAAVEEHFYKF